MGLCSRVVFAITFFFALCLTAISFAGNQKMVENRTEEMDDQNKQMVRQIPNLPKNGNIDAKARVADEGGNLIFDIYQVKTSTKEENLDFNREQQKKGVKDELTSDSGKNKKKSSSIAGKKKKEKNKKISDKHREY